VNSNSLATHWSTLVLLISFALLFGVAGYWGYINAPKCISKYGLFGIICEGFGARNDAYFKFFVAFVFFVQFSRAVFLNHYIEFSPKVRNHKQNLLVFLFSLLFSLITIFLLDYFIG